jgi:osmoprotectant transport system permease protein
MAAMNASVLFSEADFSSAAQSHLETLGITYKPVENTSTLRRNVVRHLYLTGVAIVSATLIGVLLSLSVFRIGWLSRSVVYVAGLLQTIPSIALLALMIPLFGIGVFPAIIALFLYSLLPIIRNSVTALVTVDPVLQRVAKAMGMSSYQQVRHVYLPLALPSILAGIRTAAVISIGTATLAAFIGAGGLGDPIVTGLSLNDTGLILQGAIPAALMAVFAELLFEAIERFALPKYLRSIETIS